MKELLEILGFLLRISREIRWARLIFVLILGMGIVSGLANAGLLALINTALNDRETFGSTMGIAFVALCLLLPGSRLLSRMWLVQLSFRGVEHLYQHLSRQILSTPLRYLESLGPARLLAILTQDVGTINRALAQIPVLFMNLAIVLGCIVYLGWLSWMALLVLLAFIVMGALVYLLGLLMGVRFFEHSRRERDVLYSHFRGLTHGTKELKLHRERRRIFLAEIRDTTRLMQRHSFRALLSADVASSFGYGLMFVAIGLLILVLPELREFDRETVTGYTLVALHLLTPFQTLLDSLPSLGQARVAIHKLEDFRQSLAEPWADPAAVVDPGAEWRRLEISGLTHTYEDGQQAESFTVGPLDLTLTPGELVFFTGGNGSGKTTLAKLLVGLYPADRGEICLDGEPVTHLNRDEYRQRFSVVFQDFFLFDDLKGLDTPDLDRKAQEYLLSLQLDEKVSIRDGELSTVDLSQGQRKRLALLTAYLEDRPIYVFDEWAADQDPVFKDIFYLELLAQLKQREKTVCVISHDDRYYDVADRLVKLENGRVVFDGPPPSHDGSGLHPRPGVPARHRDRAHPSRDKR